MHFITDLVMGIKSMLIKATRWHKHCWSNDL